MRSTMYVIVIIIAVLLVLGMTACFYHMLKNIMTLIVGEKKNKWLERLLAAGCFVVVLYCVRNWNMGLVVMLHFMGFSLAFLLVDLLVKGIAKSRYENFSVWKKLQKCYVLPLLGTVLMIGCGYWNMHHIVETDYTVTTRKDIRKEGYRVALLADIHFGVSIDIEEIQRVCREIESKNPDMVILCGDMVDEITTYEQMDQLFQALGTIKSTYGTYYVYGNHDRQNYSMNPVFTDKDIVEKLSENGITLLQDEKKQITEDLVLVGREDASVGSRSDLADLYEAIDENDFILTLDHQPLEYEYNQELGTDLLLSGHTHGGQFFPVNILMKMIHFGDAVYGSTEKDAFLAFVTSGVAGWKFPIKTSAPAEYVIIDILGKSE